jgi:hypothetical protein
VHVLQESWQLRQVSDVRNCPVWQEVHLSEDVMQEAQIGKHGRQSLTERKDPGPQYIGRHDVEKRENPVLQAVQVEDRGEVQEVQAMSQGEQEKEIRKWADRGEVQEAQAMSQAEQEKEIRKWAIMQLVHVVAEPEQLAQGDVQEAQAEPFQKVPEAHGLQVDPDRV